MRDVLELNLLLKDFVADETRIELWLNASSSVIKKQFSANTLRQRLANRLGLQACDLPDYNDYQAHSQILHVCPVMSDTGKFLAVPGRSKAMVGRDAIQWIVLSVQDMYHHAAAILTSIDELGAALAGIHFSRSYWNEHRNRSRRVDGGRVARVGVA
jgi:hypothetical protein